MTPEKYAKTESERMEGAKTAQSKTVYEANETRGYPSGKCQRGFVTRREAQEWESQFKLQQSADIDMTVEVFYELYEQDIRPRLKENTWMTKQVIYEKKILTYLGKREITAKDVINWQNEMMKHKKPDRRLKHWKNLIAS